MAKNQWRTDLNGVVGLDYTAVFSIAKGIDVEITPCVMEKLEAIESYTMKYFRKKVK